MVGELARYNLGMRPKQTGLRFLGYDFTKEQIAWVQHFHWREKERNREDKMNFGFDPVRSSERID